MSIMDSVPNEVLEKILSFCDRDSVLACRQVSKRWNEVTITVMRTVSTTVRVEFVAAQSVREFLSDMEFGIQGFPFSRFGFTSLNRENVAAFNQFLRDCSHHVRDLDIRVRLDTRREEEGRELVDLISCLQTTILLKLTELRVEQRWMPLHAAVVIPELDLSNLRILTLPFAPISYPIPAALIRGAPNLRLLKIQIQITTASTDFQWPLPDSCKRINSILVDLKLDIFDDGNLQQGDGSGALVALLRKVEEEWSNVRVQRLSLHSSEFLQPELTLQIQRFLDVYADCIKKLTLAVQPLIAQGTLKIPVMPELRDLHISLARAPLDPIQGNHFSRLQEVTLRSYQEPISFFRSAKLESVQTFVLHATRGGGVGGDYTPWDKVFPNLTSFTYCYYHMSDFNALEFLVSVMRMDSLTNVQYKVVGNYRLEEQERERHQVRINRIFSGFDNLEEIVEKTNEAREQGGDAEELYWQSVEQFRRPCLANMTGIKKLQLDLHMDDNFAVGVLLRLNPLNLLTIDAKELSLGVFCRLISRHNSFCSSQVG